MTKSRRLRHRHPPKLQGLRPGLPLPPKKILKKNISVITKVAHEVLDFFAEAPDLTDAEIAEAVKRHCAKLHIAYRSDVVCRAIDSALFQRQRAGKPSLIRSAPGEAAFRLQFG